MCGRITQNVKSEKLVEKYRVRLEPGLDFTPHYNGTPGQEFLVVRSVGNQRELREMQWGEIPEWARNQPGARRLINARSESVHEKPSFKGSFRQRRCVIPVNGWFEWRPEEDGKQPYWIRPEGTELFSLAGIWEPGSGTRGSRATFVILTTAAAPGIADIHHRQPAILDEEATEAWLKPGWGADSLIAMLQSGFGGEYERRAVSPEVSNPRNDSADLLEPMLKSS